MICSFQWEVRRGSGIPWSIFVRFGAVLSRALHSGCLFWRVVRTLSLELRCVQRCIAEIILLWARALCLVWSQFSAAPERWICCSAYLLLCTLPNPPSARGGRGSLCWNIFVRWGKTGKICWCRRRPWSFGHWAQISRRKVWQSRFLSHCWRSDKLNTKDRPASHCKHCSCSLLLLSNFHTARSTPLTSASPLMQSPELGRSRRLMSFGSLEGSAVAWFSPWLMSLSKSYSHPLSRQSPGFWASSHTCTFNDERIKYLHISKRMPWPAVNALNFLVFRLITVVEASLFHVVLIAVITNLKNEVKSNNSVRFNRLTR